MTTENLDRILTYFDQILPHAACELNYRAPHELLIAVVLSAQTTDNNVNAVTPHLFRKYPSVASLAVASLADVESIIKTIGLYHTKARHIIEICRMLHERFSDAVPMSKEDLLSLPGVGVKTANVVRAELFHIPEIAVDTHVARVSKRLKFASMSDDVTKIEAKLRKTLPRERYIKTHHQMLHFGRYHCTARRPSCMSCPLVGQCAEKNKNLFEKQAVDGV